MFFGIKPFTARRARFHQKTRFGSLGILGNPFQKQWYLGMESKHIIELFQNQLLRRLRSRQRHYPAIPIHVTMEEPVSHTLMPDTSASAPYTTWATTVRVSPWSPQRIKLLSKCRHFVHNPLLCTRQVTRATHVRNRVCPRVELILKIIIILLIIFLGFIKSKPC